MDTCRYPVELVGTSLPSCPVKFLEICNVIEIDLAFAGKKNKGKFRVGTNEKSGCSFLLNTLPRHVERCLVSGRRVTLSYRRPSPQETDSGSGDECRHLIFGARAGQHGNVGRMRAPRDDLASWSSTCHHARLVVTFYESTTTGGYDGTRVTSFTRCCNCLRFRKPRYFRFFPFLFIFSPLQLQFARRGYEEFPKREIERERQ